MRKEILAGLSTFFTLAYLLLLYPQLMSAGGFDFGASLVAMVLTLFVSTLFLAFYAHFPVVLASGLSVVSYIIFSAIPMQGILPMEALGAVFWAGLIVFLLSAFKVRQKILLHLPPAIKCSAIGGIGLFLICIALKNLHILFPHPGKIVDISQVLSIPTGITALGLVLLWMLHQRQISSAFLLSIFACWLLGASLGFVHWQGFAALPPSLSPSFLQLDLLSTLHPKFWGVLLSILLISLFDSSGSLTALARLIRRSDGPIERIDRIVIPDGLGSMLAALLGATSLSFTLESSSGIHAGGRRGLTAIVAAFACLIALFLVPLLSSIPFFASAPALIAIGVSMVLSIKEINWKEWTDAAPALITLVTIPVTFSIYNGFAYGFVSYAISKTISGKFREVHPITWGLALVFTGHLAWTLSIH